MRRENFLSLNIDLSNLKIPEIKRKDLQPISKGPNGKHYVFEHPKELNISNQKDDYPLGNIFMGNSFYATKIRFTLTCDLLLSKGRQDIKVGIVLGGRKYLRDYPIGSSSPTSITLRQDVSPFEHEWSSKDWLFKAQTKDIYNQGVTVYLSNFRLELEDVSQGPTTSPPATTQSATTKAPAKATSTIAALFKPATTQVPLFPSSSAAAATTSSAPSGSGAVVPGAPENPMQDQPSDPTIPLPSQQVAAGTTGAPLAPLTFSVMGRQVQVSTKDPLFVGGLTGGILLLLGLVFFIYSRFRKKQAGTKKSSKK